LLDPFVFGLRAGPLSALMAECPMPAAHVQSYLTKARDFLKGMNLPENLAERECRYSSALLAIHCAISYSDALRVGLGERLSELTSDD
jgi:hypothetical protein